jgi:putative oxygen-independent coproporphyrinogen III oxidase
MPLEPPPRSAYVHLPFCRRRCFYCDFPIQVVGERPGAADDAAEAYCKLLRREIAATPAGSPEPLRTLYFGGGTPSLTPPALLAQVIEAIRQRYGLTKDCEVTLEVDPGTFDAARLAAFLDAGVTRVSLGVQSFDAALLERAGRVHDAAAAQHAIDLLLSTHAATGSPLRSISIDLIGGLPQQTRPTWQASLATAAASGVHHVSVYDLQIEARTAFGKWYEPGVHPLPAEEVAADMYRDASRVLGAAGFEHYEVSNFARPGSRSAHNQAYWRNEPFFAFGALAAHSSGPGGATPLGCAAAAETCAAVRCARAPQVWVPRHTSRVCDSRGRGRCERTEPLSTHSRSPGSRRRTSAAGCARSAATR